jgi:hypothetical protein
MNQHTLEAFLRLYGSSHGQASNWMGIVVTVPGSGQHEVIINPKENFESKMEYYQKVYDDELKHKNAPLEILRFGFSPTLHGLINDELFIEHGEHINIKFQQGPIPLVGRNGAFIEDVIDVLIDRLVGFQEGDYACDENDKAIEHLEAAKDALIERAMKRTEQGVEGTYQSHES